MDILEAMFDEALDLIERKKFVEAEEKLKQIIKIDPTFAEAHLKLGDLAFLNNRLKEALERYLVVSTLKPDNEELWLSIGNLYLRLKMPQEAIKYLTKYLTVHKDKAEIYGKLGVAYLLQKDIDKAITFLKKNLVLTPSSVFAWYYLALAYLEKGDRKEAEEYLNNVIDSLTMQIEENDKNPVYYFFRGRAHYWLGNLEEARKDIEKAIELDVEYIDYHLEEGLGYSDADAFVALAEVLKKLSDYYLEKALEVDPNNNLANIYLSSKRQLIW